MTPAQIAEAAKRATTLKGYYAQARKAGYPAWQALHVAKTLREWGNAQLTDSVRISLYPEEESYFDVYGSPEAYTDVHGRRVSEAKAGKEMEELLDRWGCYVVVSEYFDGSQWVRADSIGMCVYESPDDWRQNWYVTDLMRAALDKLSELKEDRQWAAECALETLA